jgi:hypothetical protein
MGVYAREFLHFLSSVVLRVSAYVTGGVAIAVVTVYERYAEKSVPWGRVRLGLVAFLLVAVYRTWQKEYRRVRELEHQQSEERRRQRDILGRFMIRGQELAQKLAQGHGPSENVDMDDIQDVEEWASNVEIYLRGAYGQAHVARFQQGALFPAGIVSPQNISRWREDCWERAVHRRCANLETFIKEVPQQRAV